MIQRRRFHRVTLSARTDLIYQEVTYHGRLENLSLRGALISANECLMIPNGDFCTLLVPVEEGKPPMVLTAQVIHYFFSMVGVKFVELSPATELRLFELLQTMTGEPEQLLKEWAALQDYRAQMNALPGSD
jgi:c-di-GMP-binding flagellar brake protein YcgR